MKYYLHNGAVMAFEDDGSQDSFIPDGANQISEQAALDIARPPAPTESELLKAALIQIDADIDAIMISAVGQRAKEYEFRESDARAFKELGYTGTVGPYLQDHISASGMTAQAAADNVIAQADAWMGALKVMSTQRLAAKAGVRAGNRVAIMQAWAGFVAQMRAALGI